MDLNTGDIGVHSNDCFNGGALCDQPASVTRAGGRDVTAAVIPTPGLRLKSDLTLQAGPATMVGRRDQVGLKFANLLPVGLPLPNEIIATSATT